MEFIQIARESVRSYEIVGERAMVQLQELLAVIIGSRATPEKCAVIAQQGVESLSDMSIEELKNFGLTDLEALNLHSSFLLAKKINRSKRKKGSVVRSPEDAADYLMNDLRYLKQEHLVVLFLNTKNVVIKKSTVFIGSLNASIVHPREIFKEAVRLSAASIIIGHNHPSGDPTPSREDIEVSRRLVEAGNILGITTLDHVIIGNGKYVSLKERGDL